MGDVAAEMVEIYSDEALRLATGLVSVVADGPGDAANPGPQIRHEVSQEVWREIFRGMLRVHRLELRLTAATAAGRLPMATEVRESMPAPAYELGGLEAATIAPLATLTARDWVVPGHREGAAALYRGLPLRAYLANVLGNANDRAKGRQAPGHPVGARALNVLPASASASTHLPQAAGLAWAAKIKRDDTVVLCYLDAAATAGEDFHTGLNFAAVFRVPAVFVCINTVPSVAANGSSTTSASHLGVGVGLGSETVAVKALAYGIPGIRVDGGDAVAVFQVARAAVEAARRGGGPTLIEAVTERLARQVGVAAGPGAPPAPRREPAFTGDPMLRLSRWLNESGILGAADQVAWAAEIDAEIDAALAAETAVPAPSVGTLVEDVYASPPAALLEQGADLQRIRRKH
jgi:2-oxoisovalerate dehydrogenase E1 component alpha subunit